MGVAAQVGVVFAVVCSVLPLACSGRTRLRIRPAREEQYPFIHIESLLLELGSGSRLRLAQHLVQRRQGGSIVGGVRGAQQGHLESPIPGWGFSPRTQIAVPTGNGIPNVQGTNLPRLTGSQDAYYTWVSNASLVPPDGNMTIMTGRDQEDMTDMERKVLVAQKSLQQLEASQKVEASTVEARFEIERNELLGLEEKKKMEAARVLENEIKIRKMKQELREAYREITRGEMLKRDPALADACAPGFQIYFTQAMENHLGRDDKRVVAKALKDQYCDLHHLTCLCDEKKRKKGKAMSPIGSVRDRLDCKCATKLRGSYRSPKDLNDLLARLGHRDLVGEDQQRLEKDEKDRQAAAATAQAASPPGTSATPTLPGAPPPATLPVQQAALQAAQRDAIN